MTEKRFTLKGLVEGVPNIADKGEIIEQEDAIRLLNKQEERIKELDKENEQLKKELFECEKEYIIETYHDNAIRRDEKIQSLKEEFKARFGDVE